MRVLWTKRSIRELAAVSDHVRELPMSGRNPFRAPKRTACIFCEGIPLTETHIWPNWLRKILPKEQNYFEDIDVAESESPVSIKHIKWKQKFKRDLFSKSPLLTCQVCNGGWMKEFEDNVVDFLKPILANECRKSLTKKEENWLAAWASLITILAEYSHYRDPTIKPMYLKYLKEKKIPPDNFTIMIAQCEGPKWRKHYSYHNFFVNEGRSVLDIPLKSDGSHAYNTQITSMGIGNLFVQVFTCENNNITHSYRIRAKASGLVHLWPSQYWLWPFIQRGLKFPLITTLSDDRADSVASDFKIRMAVDWEFNRGRRF